MEFENQMKMLEKGKQIGYRTETGEVYLQCGIQKKEDSLYFVYFFKHDFENDDYDHSDEEFYSFLNFDEAVKYIISRNFPFEEFKPQKGNKIFDINNPKFPKQISNLNDIKETRNAENNQH